jgi:hypothetical protein
MFLGLDTNTGLVYEGVGAVPDRPVVPVPMVSQAKLILQPRDWNSLPGGVKSSALTWMFREDAFDPVTRTRRGRLYQWMTNASYPDPGTRVMPHPFEDTRGRYTASDGKLPRPLNVYAAGTNLLQQPRQGLGATLALGNNLGASAWRIVNVEITASDDVMLVLRSLSAFGVMPDLDAGKIDERFRHEVALAVQKVVDSAFRESPVAVVECCRDAAALVASRWICQQSGDEAILRKDLSNVAETSVAALYDKRVAANAARTLAILHSRGKSNEQFAKGVNPPTEEDAEYALHGLALILRELGWAVLQR